MRVFEYRVVSVNDSDSAVSIEQQLADFGASGWELVAAVSILESKRIRLFFKRDEQREEK